VVGVAVETLGVTRCDTRSAPEASRIIARKAKMLAKIPNMSLIVRISIVVRVTASIIPPLLMSERIRPTTSRKAHLGMRERLLELPL